MTKRKPMFSLAKIKKAARLRREADDGVTVGHLFCCRALEAHVGRDARDNFSEMFRPDWHLRYPPCIVPWTFNGGNDSPVSAGSDDVGSVRDLAMCLFYEMVKSGDV